MWLGLLKGLCWARRIERPELNKFTVPPPTSCLHSSQGLCDQVFNVSSNPRRVGLTSVSLGRCFTGLVSLRSDVFEVNGSWTLRTGVSFSKGFCLQIWKTGPLWRVCFPGTKTEFVNICLWKVAFLNIMAWSSKPVHKWIFSAHGNLLHLNIKIHWGGEKGEKEMDK